MLKQKDVEVLKDLQTQEKTCIEKYTRFSQEAHDEQLKDLFSQIAKKEQEHYDSLEKAINGCCPSCNCNDSDGENYQPKQTYDQLDNSKEKQDDAFLVTDCIGTEKLTSSEYNCKIFSFEDAKLRKLLADIQIEEQNHAEMLYKYKQANCM